MSEFASTYDTLAPAFDDWAAAVAPPARERWVAKLHDVVAAGERVVELGCGTGVPIGRMLAERHEYTGVDASPGMLARARAALPPAATLVHADMETVSFEPASLGAVVAFYSIIHVRRECHAALFASIATWLRPGGAFVGCLHSRDEPDDFAPNWLGAGPMRWSGFDADTNRALLGAAGLAVIEAEVVEQVEPDGCRIKPWFVLARR